MKIVVVGAGVSACHAALTLLERGHGVEMWDVGRQEVAFTDPGVSFHELKQRVDDPLDHFLGRDLSALIPPGAGELLRYPPARHFLSATNDPLWPYVGQDFVPYASFSAGGLANGWGANASSYDADDLRDWPLSFADLEPDYHTVYGRVPVAGPDRDDLSPFLAGVHTSQPAMALSPVDRKVMDTYTRRRAALTRRGVHLGWARLAVVTDPTRADACDHCDRCLWGCPRGSLYNPAHSTLKECLARPGFSYLPGRLVLELITRDRRVTGIRYQETDTGRLREAHCDAVFLAAGALQSGTIFLRSLRSALPGQPAESEGLLDTRVVKLPYVALSCLGMPPEPRVFQFNRLLMGIVTERPNNGPAWPRFLQGEVLHLGGLVYHPLIESMPFDSRLSKRLFFAMRSALGVLTLFFPDRPTPGNRLVLEAGADPAARVRLEYRETAAKQAYMDQCLDRARGGLRHLGCLPKGAVVSPPGGGIHYAGTIPMGAGPKRCGADGRANLLANLYIADGAAFPSLPSKSITMSLAAHASRVARLARL